VHVTEKTRNNPKIVVDTETLVRAFVNIIRNAIDAMPNGGTLTISSRQTATDLEFAFSDTGLGMSKEVLDRMWTPFFTTKAKGMGLGLSICKRIVEAHNGKISVSSVEGEGTTFTVTFPIEPDVSGGEIS
jgi:signal transduction histidine kinase